MSKQIEFIGFIIEVNSFFWSGWLYAKGLLLYALVLLLFSFCVAFYVGGCIYNRGVKSVTPAPCLFQNIKDNN